MNATDAEPEDGHLSGADAKPVGADLSAAAGTAAVSQAFGLAPAVSGGDAQLRVCGVVQRD